MVPDGWIWRGDTRLEFEDPRHVLRGAGMDVHVGQVTLRDYQDGGPREYHENVPAPLAAIIPEPVEAEPEVEPELQEESEPSEDMEVESLASDEESMSG